MKAKEKRKVRGYKIADTKYNKAMKRAGKEKIPLATLIEDIVSGYADGMEEYLFLPKNQSIK